MRIFAAGFSDRGILLAFQPQRRVVGEDCSYAHHHCVGLGAERVNSEKIVRTGDLGLFSFPGGKFSVSTHCCVDYHIRTHTYTRWIRERRLVMENRMGRKSYTFL